MNFAKVFLIANHDQIMMIQINRIKSSENYTMNKCKLFEFITRRNVKNKSNCQPIQNSENSFQSQQLPLCQKQIVFYAVFDKHTLDHVYGCVYVYENQQPGQILKMLLEKFTSTSRMPNLIFPSSHVKDNVQDKSVSIFFIKERIIPLTLFTETQYEMIDVRQMLKLTYDGLCSLHYLHSHEIVHGNISLNTCYVSKGQKDTDLALNILDINIFKEDLIKPKQALIFMSQSQQNGLKTSYKDDAESMMYIILHLVSKGKMLSKQRFTKQWVNQSQLLRWKSMDFFREMVEILPPQLSFLSEVYTIIKSLTRNQKPDYPKFIKKTFSKLKQQQNLSISQGNDSENHYEPKANQIISLKKKNKNGLQQEKNQKKKYVDKLQQQEIQLLVMDSDNEENGLQSKFSKLQSTKCTVKTKRFWNEKVESGQ